jgi:hypothetical protein
MLGVLVVFGIAVESHSLLHFVGTVGFGALLVAVLVLYQRTLSAARTESPERHQEDQPAEQPPDTAGEEL